MNHFIAFPPYPQQTNRILRARNTNWLPSGSLKIANFRLVLCLAWLIAPSPLLGNELASPAVDASIYREGEVRRVTQGFGAWSTVCDEIQRLKQRFCSLKALSFDSTQRPLAEIVMSTGDNGKPAALVRVATGAHIGSGIKIRLEPGARQPSKKAETPPERRLSFIGCDATSCRAVWSLSGGEISALNAGFSLRLKVTRIQPFSRLTPVIAAADRLIALEGVTSGAGLSEAVTWTLK